MLQYFLLRQFLCSGIPSNCTRCTKNDYIRTIFVKLFEHPLATRASQVIRPWKALFTEFMKLDFPTPTSPTSRILTYGTFSLLVLKYLSFFSISYLFLAKTRNRKTAQNMTVQMSVQMRFPNNVSWESFEPFCLCLIFCAFYSFGPFTLQLKNV